MADCCNPCLFLACTGALVFFCYEASVFIPILSRHYDYVPAALTVRQIDLSYRHCCRLDCFCAEVDDPKAEGCFAMQNRSEALSPSLCSSASSSAKNSSLCPPTGSAAVCNNGAFCCTACNQTCPIKPETVCKCPCNGCGGTCLNCCKHVEGQLCRLFCDPCYKVNMTVGFTDRHGTHRIGIIQYNAGPNEADAQEHYSAHAANSTFLGFYKPSDPTILHVSRGYEVNKWVAFIFLSALPLFLLGLVTTWFIIAVVLRAWRGEAPSAAMVFWANWVLWLGIIWPFFILLLILELSYPTPRAKTALRTLIPIFVCIGWAPSLSLCLCQG